MMETSEKEMVRQLAYEDLEKQKKAEKFTSLQPTYEDSVPPDPEHDWELDD
jgi:hypothetical protein